MPEPMPVPTPSPAPLPLTDLFSAVSAHTGDFTCTRLRKPFDTRVVTFRHLIQPPAALEPLNAQDVPAPASEATAAQSPTAIALPDVGQLRAFYATFGA